MKHRHLGLIVAVLAAFFVASCGHRTLRLYSNVAISADAVARRPGLPGLGTWHVLERGPGVVLDAFIFDPGARLTFDDEVCSTVLVEIPRSALAVLPARVMGPVSYLTTCSCTWHICREERAESGAAIVRRQSSSAIDVEMNLRFPSKVIHVAGRFKKAAPSDALMPGQQPPEKPPQ